ncbi:MAG: putative Phosphoribosyltransferase [Candidatus Saccharibacteria bacterium]|nr:putative Phosphoribosyltransferase [Candidatus Saccharibacteria bacterium]
MSFFEAAIGWIAPPECAGCGAEGAPLCLPCSLAEIVPYGERCFRCGSLSSRAKTCQTCRAGGAPNFVWVSTDYAGTAQKLIQRYKFAHQRIVAYGVAAIMAETFLAQNDDALIKRKNYLVVAVPTASIRIRERSFDHTKLLAKFAAARLRFQTKPALARRGNAKQVGSTRAERTKQAKGSYFVRNEAAVRGRNILLIDDVITTGATLSEAARVLRASGARSVDALVFAKRL